MAEDQPIAADPTDEDPQSYDDLTREIVDELHRRANKVIVVRNGLFRQTITEMTREEFAKMKGPNWRRSYG